MENREKFYIDGGWVPPTDGCRWIEVINPATEQPIARVPEASASEVDRAVSAASEAFGSWSRTPPAERADLLDQVSKELRSRAEEIGRTISEEMGMPLRWAVPVQAGLPARHFRNFANLLREYEFEHDQGTTRIVQEPIGVCVFITPWNYPLHQVAGKVAPALAAGCSVVLKPSEVAPLDAVVLAEILEAVGLPPGVFNLLHGEGPRVGRALVAHPKVDMVSFTGSTRAGVEVATAAAGTVKRVTQELGGKSPNILLEDADFPKAVSAGLFGCFMNSGQACNAPTRMLVPKDRQEEVISLAEEAVKRIKVGVPEDPEATLGPLVSQQQFERVQEMIKIGVAEGARLIFGGLGRPEGLTTGYYARPTLFADVNNQMRMAREEIFGPVLCLIPYVDEQEAVTLANDTPYGLSGYVWSQDLDRARKVAGQLRVGQVHLNGAPFDPQAPFGGYKASGNGREFGRWGFEEFLETKAILGFAS